MPHPPLKNTRPFVFLPVVLAAAFVKKEDPNHLLTVGEDGFYGCCKAPANPGVQWSEWAAEEGQDFIADHASPHIDFASFHGWVSGGSPLGTCFGGTVNI